MAVWNTGPFLVFISFCAVKDRRISSPSTTVQPALATLRVTCFPLTSTIAGLPVPSSIWLNFFCSVIILLLYNGTAHRCKGSGRFYFILEYKPAPRPLLSPFSSRSQPRHRFFDIGNGKIHVFPHRSSA